MAEVRDGADGVNEFSPNFNDTPVIDTGVETPKNTHKDAACRGTRSVGLWGTHMQWRMMAPKIYHIDSVNELKDFYS